jgi:hypothetical protein
MRVLIVGAGAIGGYFGGKMLQGRISAGLHDRWRGRHLRGRPVADDRPAARANPTRRRVRTWSTDLFVLQEQGSMTYALSPAIQAR